MYTRLLKLPLDGEESIFLFGPRGTGKTFWITTQIPNAVHINLLKFSSYQKLSNQPESLIEFIPPGYEGWIVIDEVQRIPELLNEVHDQIEAHGRKFILTGSSSRSLKRKGVNLLAGRALQYHMHPLLCDEIGDQFDIKKTLEFGLLPKAQLSDTPQKYLETYIRNYIREEVFQEALARNINAFFRFLEAASFSQGQMLNILNISREVGVERATISNYFDILEDLLIGVRIEAFTKRAQRDIKTHSKFYYFDVGVYRTLRPAGYLDSPEEMDSAELETLFLQSTRAINDYHELKYGIYFWHTAANLEVDFVLYGKRGLFAFEIKRTRRVDKKMLRGLKAFKKDYPEAKLYLVYMGFEKLFVDDIHIIPIAELLKSLSLILKNDHPNKK